MRNRKEDSLLNRSQLQRIYVFCVLPFQFETMLPLPPWCLHTLSWERFRVNDIPCGYSDVRACMVDPCQKHPIQLMQRGRQIEMWKPILQATAKWCFQSPGGSVTRCHPHTQAQMLITQAWDELLAQSSGCDYKWVHTETVPQEWQPGIFICC